MRTPHQPTPAEAAAPDPDGSRRIDAHLTTGAPWFVADWRDLVFVHFAVPASELAPHVPWPLETMGGRAFVSLVSFTLNRLRPARALPAKLGRWLMRPASDHPFLNVRTYVRGPAGPGIHFLTEWINNPLSLRVGPRLYGLPYRFANMVRVDRAAGGVTQIRVTDPACPGALGITVSHDRAAPLARCAPGSVDALLLEQYTAYTHRRGVDRFFQIHHPPWEAARTDLVRTDTSLVEFVYPWFRYAEPLHAHVSPGFDEVRMGPPRPCRRVSPVPVSADPMRQRSVLPLEPARES